MYCLLITSPEEMGRKMASTAAYNLQDKRIYSITNFNFNVTDTLQQLNILSRNQAKYCQK